jgi:glycosyltransferase involved in cell wall biosynthesis
MNTQSAASSPDFSLIVATKDRTELLERLLQSMDDQTERSFEVIISDQNADDRLEPLLAPFRERFPIRHVRSSGGISRGRNAGLPLATGRYIAFPDDDCWYPKEVLATVRRLFIEHADWQIVCGRSVDSDMRPTQGRWVRQVTPINRRNVLQMGISYTIFSRAEAVAAAGPFDESLGVGAGTPWGAGEETDFLLNALRSMRTMMYVPDIYVHHPEKVVEYSKATRDRQYAYARGLGRVLCKHGYSPLEGYEHVVRPLAGSVLFLARGQADRSLYHFRVFAGRCLGWLGR